MLPAGSAGLFQAGAGGVVKPAVERTAQAAILTTGERQVGAAMGAMAVQQAVAAGRIAEQHEVLAEQADAFDRAGVASSSANAAGCQ